LTSRDELKAKFMADPFFSSQEAVDKAEESKLVTHDQVKDKSKKPLMSFNLISRKNPIAYTEQGIREDKMILGSNF
jgi:hypothetical protein